MQKWIMTDLNERFRLTIFKDILHSAQIVSNVSQLRDKIVINQNLHIIHLLNIF